MNQTIQNLSEICTEYRFKEKLLFVPSYSVGHQIGDNLTKAIGSWINLRMTTVPGYAQELVAPELNKNGIRLIDPQERFMIIENPSRS